MVQNTADGGAGQTNSGNKAKQLGSLVQPSASISVNMVAVSCGRASTTIEAG